MSLTLAKRDVTCLGINPEDALESLGRHLREVAKNGWHVDGDIRVSPTYDEDEFEWTAEVTVVKPVEVP